MLRRYHWLCRYVIILACISYLITFLIKKYKVHDKLSIPELWYTQVNDSKSCYNKTWKDNAVEDIREKMVLHNSIFFHETSCCRNLPLRQACAVESAARHHPTRQVFVLFMKSVSSEDCCEGPLDEIYKLDNVDFARIDLSYYTQGTPLENVIENSTIYGRLHQRRVAEYLKFLTLYLYGGMVVDLDMLVVPLKGSLLPSWVAMEDDKILDRLGSAVISIPKSELADQLTFQFLSALVNQTSADELDGGRAMYEVLKRHCNASDVSQMTYSKCGVHVYSSNIFYAVNLTSTSKMPDVRYAGFRIRTGGNVNSTLPKDSLFAKIAQEYCPSLFHRFIHEFVEK